MTTKRSEPAVEEAGTTEFKIPHVHQAMLKILTSMSVAKGGVLPGNMGGKDYITAPDLSAEAKRQFVENGIVMIPSEKIYDFEIVPRGDRAPSIIVSIEGYYHLYSTVDGSSVLISGVGDGMAQGTSVASNIASTNALKNALLRTFLITEQSVEDQAKGDNSPAVEHVEPRAVATAKTGGPTQKRESPQAVVDLQDQVREAWARLHPEAMDGYVALGNKKYGEPASWATNITKLKGLLKAIEAGEIA